MKQLKKEAISGFFFANDEMIPVSNIDVYHYDIHSSIFEVIRIKKSVALFFGKHMERIRHSAKLTGDNLLITEQQIIANINNLIIKNNNINNNIKIVNAKLNNENVFLMYYIHSEYPSSSDYMQGVHSILYEGERENPNIKNIKNAFKERVDEIRIRSGAREVLLVNKKGYITEGSRSNFFYINKKSIYTPPLKYVLPGITRGRIIKICERLGINVIEKELHTSELSDIKGAFLTGTSIGFLPLNSIGNRKLRSINEVFTQKIINLNNAEIEKYIEEKKNFNLGKCDILQRCES